MMRVSVHHCRLGRPTAVFVALVVLMATGPARGLTRAQAGSSQERLWQAAKLGQSLLASEALGSTPGPDLDALDPDGWTALTYASRGGHVKIVSLLLEQGADVSRTNAAGTPPLVAAAKFGRSRVVELLLEAGADIAARDAGKRTALFWAIQGGHVETVDLIRAAGGAESYELRVVQDQVLGIDPESIEPPRVIERARPEYTDGARRKGIEGTVVLKVIIRRDGKLGPVRVQKSLDSGLDRNAIQAVRLWVFEPALHDGEPIDVITEVEVEFKLDDPAP